jgi:hypothetical protein
LALLAAACGSASAGLLNLGLSLTAMPANCGYVVQVQSGDSCQSLADYGAISLAKYVQLNPLSLCGILTPAPGALTCVGDTLAFCSNYYRTVAGDTCGSIGSLLGTVLALGNSATCAAPLPVGTPVCVRPTANQCAVDTLCGTPITQPMQDLLGSIPDWCTVLSTCQAPLTATTTATGLPGFVATLSDVTPTISQVVGNEGHPELRDFVKQRAAGPVQLEMMFVPNAGGDGKHSVSFAFITGSTRRKLLGSTGRMGTYIPKRY